MAAAGAATKRGGRTQQGHTPAPSPQLPGQFGPPKATPPAPSSASGGPRTGGRTQQGARMKARTGGRTQQGAATPVSQSTAPAPAPGPAASSTGTRAPATRVSTATREGSGALLVLFAYPAAFNLLRHGPAGLRAWIKAKFINQPENLRVSQTTGRRQSTGTTQKPGTTTAGGRG